MKVRIFDEDKTLQRFSLLKLLGIIVGTLDEAPDTWSITRCWGYVLEVAALDTATDTAPVEVSLEQLASLLPGVNEWFYGIDVVSSDGIVKFGLFDSTFMFVYGPPVVLDAAQRYFDSTTLVEGLPSHPD